MLGQRTNERSGSLFPLTTNFRIVQLREPDARRESDELKRLIHLVRASEDMYPGINRWLRDKVIPGIRSSERGAWVAYEGEAAIATAILKKGEAAKFCHLRIQRDFQDLDLGRLFFTQMTLETRHIAKEIHFTLPESLWETKASFFHSFGFMRPARSCKQYRTGDDELICSAPHRVVRVAALERLPALARKFNVAGYALGGDLLVSMKPQHADRVLWGSKMVEIRRRFSQRWVGCRAVLYSSSPQKALVGEATVGAITIGTPEDIWTRFHAGLGCTYSEFSDYVGRSKEVSAIELDDVFPYKEPIPLSQISYLLGLQADLKPPQSYCDLTLDRNQNKWARATAVASVLHGRFTRPRHL